MSISPVRRVASAAAVAAAGVALLSAPAAAQNPCYPLTPGCVSTTSSTPVAGPTLILSSTTVVRGQTSTGTRTGGGGSGGGLARTGAIVVPAALVGLGLVAVGAALQRSSRRSKTSAAG